MDWVKSYEILGIISRRERILYDVNSGPWLHNYKDDDEDYE